LHVEKIQNIPAKKKLRLKLKKTIVVKMANTQEITMMVVAENAVIHPADVPQAAQRESLS